MSLGKTLGEGAGGAVMLAGSETGKRVTVFRSFILCTMIKGLEGIPRKVHGRRGGGFQAAHALSALVFSLGLFI